MPPMSLQPAPRAPHAQQSAGRHGATGLSVRMQATPSGHRTISGASFPATRRRGATALDEWGKSRRTKGDDGPSNLMRQFAAETELSINVEVNAPSAEDLLPNKEFGSNGRTFRETFDIRAVEIDHVDKKASVTTMTNLLQECAANHTYGLWGRGADNGYASDPLMEKDSLAFVLQRMMVRFDEYPGWTDKVRVETWFAESGRIGARRDWTVTDLKSGKVIGGATSNWVLINLKKRRLARMPEDLRQKNLARSPQPERWALGEGVQVEKIQDPNPEDDHLECVGQAALVARRSDMDMNGHVNNVTYLDWALESVPQEQLDTHSIMQLEVEYKNECMVGERIETISCRHVDSKVTEPEGAAEYSHVVRKVEDGKELVVMRTLWRPKVGI